MAAELGESRLSASSLVVVAIVVSRARQRGDAHTPGPASSLELQRDSQAPATRQNPKKQIKSAQASGEAFFNMRASELSAPSRDQFLVPDMLLMAPRARDGPPKAEN